MTCLVIISKQKPLGEYMKWFKGITDIGLVEKGSVFSKRKKSVWKFHMMSIWFGKNGWKPLRLQNNDTIRFVKKYGAIIKKLNRKIRGLEIYIDYPAQCRLDDKVAVQQDEIPLSLIKLCSKYDIYINIALYAREIGLTNR